MDKRLHTKAVGTMQKHASLLKLAKKRQATRWRGYSCIGDYHNGVYECDLVSPYTKSAGAVDSEILVMLQDWSSDNNLAGPIDEQAVSRGHTPGLATNRNLTRLLRTTFGVELAEVYATNLFPFVKPGPMSGSIPHKDLVRAARQFAVPQIDIVNPLLVVCLGIATFNALRDVAAGLPPSSSLESAIESPFELGNAIVWCQAHTGAWGQYNRNRRIRGAGDLVSRDWQTMHSHFLARKQRIRGWLTRSGFTAG